MTHLEVKWNVGSRQMRAMHVCLPEEARKFGSFYQEMEFVKPGRMEPMEAEFFKIPIDDGEEKSKNKKHNRRSSGFCC